MRSSGVLLRFAENFARILTEIFLCDSPIIYKLVGRRIVSNRLAGLTYLAMQLWFARGTDVTLREQLVTQIIIGILSNDLAPGERLPSTREVARRFRVHPNTVSAGYRQLERERWVEFRHGSGVYVRDSKPDASLAPEVALDQLVVNLFRAARKLDTPLAALRSRLQYWLTLQPPDHFLFVDSDEGLRRIIAHEMQSALPLPVKTCGLHHHDLLAALDGAIPVVLPRNAAAVRQVLPSAVELITLSLRSVPTSLAKWLPSPPGTLVGIASGWPNFLKSARTVLLAAGFDKDALLFRDVRKANWQRGLNQVAAVICDSVTVRSLPKTSRPIVFPLISDSSLSELKQYQDFLRNPLRASM